MHFESLGSGLQLGSFKDKSFWIKKMALYFASAETSGEDQKVQK